MACFDKVTAAQSAATTGTAADSVVAPAMNGASPSPSPVKREANGTSKKRSSPTPDDDDEDALSSVADTPPPKRKKIEKSQAETDAEYAKRLQEELNRITGRATRGGGAGTKRKPVVKKQRKKKSKAHVGSDDDSDAESGEKKEVKRTGGFHVSVSYHASQAQTNVMQKPMALSPQLSALVNETQLSRPQTVKKIWEYIKGRDLQDPSDKRQIICDDAMRSVFKTDKVHMFTMNKIINTHLYEVEEV
jgi:upstream activation factor subunit UAF30